jgi:hypothetical protein
VKPTHKGEGYGLFGTGPTKRGPGITSDQPPVTNHRCIDTSLFLLP